MNSKDTVRRYRFMCKACEIGKVVVNRCLKKGLKIDTAKLQKLLVLMQGFFLARYNDTLFPEDVIMWPCGVAIKEVDSQFRSFSMGFKEDLPSYIAVLEREDEIIEFVIENYGQKDVFELRKDPKLSALVINYDESKKNEIINLDTIRKVFVTYDLF